MQRTLSTWQSIERQMAKEQLETNWRLLAYLFRAYFDGHVQARFGHEQEAQDAAYVALRGAPLSGSAKALAAARYALDRNMTDPVAEQWRARVFELAETINRTVGGAVLQSQAADLNLATFAAPLSDKPFLLAQMAKIAELATEAQRLRAIAALGNWQNVADGGFFDKLGTGVLRGEAPHLVVGQGAEADPEFFHTSHQQAL